MKKIALILLGVCLILGSCKPTDKNKITYNGKNTIDIVLLEKYDLDASSGSNLTYHSDNEMAVTVNSDGIIQGKNVGDANVTISNSVNSITVKVIVSLFEEPTLNFGISKNSIEDIYGTPDYHYGDSIYVYGGGATLEDWYSYAVWRMNFFFKDNEYQECDLYINSDLKMRIDQFLSDNYHYFQTITDTVNTNETEEIVNVDLFLNAAQAEDASVLVGKQENFGTYNDICLFYVPFDYEDKSLDRSIISRKRFTE